MKILTFTTVVKKTMSKPLTIIICLRWVIFNERYIDVIPTNRLYCIINPQSACTIQFVFKLPLRGSSLEYKIV